MRKNTKRLSREEWLESALKALAKEGGSVLTIGSLVQHLNVSRGSFYWHFKDRADFEYWSVIYTQGIAVDVSQLDTSPEQRLLALMERIVSQKAIQYEIAIRAWALHEPVAKATVKKVDKFRLYYVRSLLAEIGFKGDELDMRTRTFVVYHSLETGLFVQLPQKVKAKHLRLRHKMLTQQ